jgi:DNA-binding NarL/FixJ family response regulator
MNVREMAAGSPTLYGREQELELLEVLIERIADGGTAVLVRGEAGIGKSALLQEVARRAADRGVRVARVAGVQSETHLPFAGLHFLLRSADARLDRLPGPQRSAFAAAFGMNDAASPDIFLIALAALELLAELAAESPLLVIVEDAHWLDAATLDVLAFVARRIELEPVVLLFAVRDGVDSRFDQLDLQELSLGALGDDSAGTLLDAVAPDLSAAARRRLLDEAAGNPLALIELPRALEAHHREGWSLPQRLPMTARLERAFTERAHDLPGETQTLLLVAALHDGRDVAEVVAAARSIVSHATAEGLTPAVAAGLIHVREDGLEFRHPLVRSALSQAASPGEQRAAHAALANALAADPDRSVWHSAAAAAGPDEAIAEGLEAAAERALRRGAVPTAIEALERAARLSSDEQARAARFIRAAFLSLRLGRPDLVESALREAEAVALAPRQRVRTQFFRELIERRWSGAERVPVFVELATQLRREGEDELAVQALAEVAIRCWWGNPADEIRAPVIAAAKSLRLSPETPALLEVLALADPAKQGAFVIEHLSRLSPDTESDPMELLRLGLAGTAVWADEIGQPFIVAAVDILRREGHVGLLANALGTQAWSTFHLGQWDTAATSSVEAAALAQETAQPRWEVAARLAEAAVAASRGEAERADQIAGECERALLVTGANPLLALVQMVRGRSAIAVGQYADACGELQRIFDPADPAYQPLAGVWAVVDLAEAAAHAGNQHEAREVLRPIEGIAARSGGELLHSSLRFARAVMAESADAEQLFEAALRTEATAYPFTRARLLLAHGRRLRRSRRLAASRMPLRAARDTFDALGATPWAERTRQELRAAGEATRPRTVDLRRQLSAQELQIARMAAEGLTNREIGQRLYLSHRTVGVHLYRIFPKLGISSRAQLRGVLETSS